MLLKKTTVSFVLQLTMVLGLPQTVGDLAPSEEADIETAPDLGLTLATLSCPPKSSPEFERLTTLLPKVLDNAVSISNKSWEIGTVTQALLEVYDPHFAPFEWDASAYQGRQIPWRVLEITKTAMDAYKYDWTGSPGQLGGWYDKRQEAKKSSGGTWLKEFLSNDTSRVPLRNQALVNGTGSLGDPCSVAPAVWMLGQLAERKEVRDKGYRDPQDYAWAVGNQYSNLISGPEPESHNGTYSQRDGNFAVWADMGYMIPPFLAHLGLSTDSSDFLREALKQHDLESSSLLNPDAQLYRHLNEGWDSKFWATGNGWMTYGLIRVLASVVAAGKKDEFQLEIDQGLFRLAPIFTTLFQQLNADSILPNYMMSKDETESLGESAGTALVLAAFHRFEVLAPWMVTEDMKAKAEEAFKGVMKNLKEDGWIGHVVDPSGDNGFNVDLKAKSAEGQSFMGMLWAAKLAVMHSKEAASGVAAAGNETTSE